MTRLFLSLLLFSNVVFGKNVTVALTPNFPVTLARSVVYSLLDLNKRVGKDKITFVDGFFNNKIYIEYSDRRIGLVAGEARKYTFYCRITLYPPSLPLMETTVWHEVGHCLGLKHDGYVGHIMSEKVREFDHYSPQEIEYFLNQVRKAVQ